MRNCANGPNSKVPPELGGSVRYVWLAGWDELRNQANQAGATWPLSMSRADVAREWKIVAAGRPSAPWTQVTLLSEGGLTPEKFLGKILAEKAEKDKEPG